MKPPRWTMLHPDMNYEALGFLPSFLDSNDPRPAKEQIDANYQHGGGWKTMRGFTMGEDMSLNYPGDPPFKPLAMAALRKELVVFYPGEFVAIIQPDGSFEASRVD